MESLEQLRHSMQHFGVERMYAKRLSPNDNSRNQVYLGSSFDVLNLFPNLLIYPDPSPKNDILKSSLSFSWLSEDGEALSPAPHAQLILYPQYPEVRFSGFLKGCQDAPRDLMASRLADRVLFFGVKPGGHIISHVASPEHPVAIEALELQQTDEIFIEVSIDRDSRPALMAELLRIHRLGWIYSKRLDKDRNVIPCRALNCGGYTLEAELNVVPNGDSKPDFLGWEVKQFATRNIEDVRLGSKAITLMTPEPTGGLYKENGVVPFVMQYGYPDRRGREDRMNYGGTYYNGIPASSTGHILTLSGYDPSNGTFDARNGGLLLRTEDNEALATWGFDSLLTHWNRKHSRAVYVPSLRRGTKECYQFSYANDIYLGVGTSFSLFLLAFHEGKVYYDPGIKVEHVSRERKAKRRSQFRVKARDLKFLYDRWEAVSLSG